MALDLLSRRRFAGGALASLPLMSSAMRGQTTPSAVARLPAASDAAKHLTVAVEINGKGPFRFVVDTGADRTVLADTTAKALGVVVSGTVMLAGIVRTVPADTVKVSSISVGPVTLDNLRLPILPREQLLADGYLGLDVLDGYQVILDFEDGEIAIVEPLPVLLTVYRTPGVRVVQARGSSGHLRAARCSIDHQSIAAFIDTGAESTMGNEALYRQLLDSDPSYFSRTSMTLIGLTGGTAEARLTRPRLVQIGDLSVRNAVVAIADLEVFDIWGLKDKPALLIGMNWLRQFKRVSIDYGRQQIRFEMAQTGPAASLPA